MAFREFVDQKVLRYRNNQPGKHPTTQHPPDSDCLTNPEEHEVNEDAEEAAEEAAGGDGKDTQSDYCPSESSGVQSFDGTPRSGSRSKNMNQYAAPTAPMVPKPSSMGQTKSKLHPDNFAPNQTPSTYQKQYQDSMGDRMARGNSRSKPEAASKSPSHNPPEIPAWHQDESIRVGARSASKRVDVSSADSEGGASRKRRKHTEQVHCPRPSLVVKLKVKLTRGKIPRDTHCQHPEADTNTPAAPLDPSEWPFGRLESYNSMPPTQEPRASSFTLPPHQRKNTATPSSPDSRSRPQESDTAADMLATNIPATNESASRCHSAVAVDSDVRDRDEFVAALQELEDKATRQRAAAKTSEIPNAVGQESEHVEPQAQVLENPNNTPAAMSTHDLDDKAAHSTVPEANKTSAKVDPTIIPTHSAKKIASMSADVLESMQGVAISVTMKREGQMETVDIFTIEKPDIMSAGYFFSDDIRVYFGDKLSETDIIKQAKVKRTSEAPVTGLRTEFTIVQGSKKNSSWEFLLKGLDKIYKKDGVFVELELEVCLLVGKEPDQKAVK